MDISLISTQYMVRILDEEDVPQIYELCSKNLLYYQYCPPIVTEDLIRSDMKALPPGKALENKYYLGFFDNNRLIAVMDFICAFPDEQTDFIGFFMVDSSLQKIGIGSSIIRELCAYLKCEGTTSVRLGWVNGNLQAEHFWKKNGFVETGVISKTPDYEIVIAEKRLENDKH